MRHGDLSLGWHNNLELYTIFKHYFYKINKYPINYLTICLIETTLKHII